MRFTPGKAPARRSDDTPRDLRTPSPSAPQASDGAHGAPDPRKSRGPVAPGDPGDPGDAEPPQTTADASESRDTGDPPRTPRRGRARKHRQTRTTAKRAGRRRDPEAPPSDRARPEDTVGPRDPADAPGPEPADTPDPAASSPAAPTGGASGPDGGDGSDTPGGPGEFDAADGGEPPEEPGTPEPSGRRRLAAALWPPRVSRAQLVVGILLFALGAALAIQVRSNTESDPLRGARESDLVRVLDELEQRTARLDSEKSRLEIDRAELESSNNAAEEARVQTDQRAQVLGILAGTVKATGPGITLTITDPKGAVTADMLLDTLQELRAAGAEAVQVNQVRVAAETHFIQSAPGAPIFVDEQPVTQPYVFKVIGNPQDLEPALNIPGGVIRTLERKEAQAVVVPSQQVVVDALRVPTTPDYARSAPDAGNDG
ncbi:DUF881 domain-containing protein [Yinghuangia sp. ASG 101]|uniref:DUF881 domain-containing protein n=1 Tax=Yinghuangia sp. ASG 101 TaxID=2896848 RepID=UPI003FCE53CB